MKRECRLLCPDPQLRLTAEEALDQPWLQRHRHHASPARDSAGRVALHSLALCRVISAVFSLYFYLLSHYFNIETERLMYRLWSDTPLFSSLYLAASLSPNCSLPCTAATNCN